MVVKAVASQLVWLNCTSCCVCTLFLGSHARLSVIFPWEAAHQSSCHVISCLLKNGLLSNELNSQSCTLFANLMSTESSRLGTNHGSRIACSYIYTIGKNSH